MRENHWEKHHDRHSLEKNWTWQRNWHANLLIHSYYFHFLDLTWYWEWKLDLIQIPKAINYLECTPNIGWDFFECNSLLPTKCVNRLHPWIIMEHWCIISTMVGVLSFVIQVGNLCMPFGRTLLHEQWVKIKKKKNTETLWRQWTQCEKKSFLPESPHFHFTMFVGFGFILELQSKWLI